MRKFKCYVSFCQFNNRGYCKHPEWHDANVADGVCYCCAKEYSFKKIAAFLIPIFVLVVAICIAVYL